MDFETLIKDVSSVFIQKEKNWVKREKRNISHVFYKKMYVYIRPDGFMYGLNADATYKISYVDILKILKKNGFELFKNMWIRLDQNIYLARDDRSDFSFLSDLDDTSDQNDIVICYDHAGYPIENRIINTNKYEIEKFLQKLRLGNRYDLLLLIEDKLTNIK